MGSDVNSTSRTFGTPLSLASARGRVNIVKLLVGRVADTQARGGGFGSALHAACVRQGTTIVDFLVQHGALVEEKRHFRHETPAKLQLMWLHGGNYPVCQDDYAKGWHWSEQLHTTSKCQPLFIATWYGRTDVVEFLVRHGASVNEPANVRQADRGKDYTMTPLFAAAINGCSSVVRILLQHHADPSLPESDTEKSALIAATIAGHTKCVELLLEYRAPVNAKDSSGRTALIYAAQLGHLEIIDLLLSKSASVKLKNNDGCTPLMSLAVRDDVSRAQKLVDNGARVDVRDENRKTALMVAAENGNHTFVELLLELKARTELTDRNGDTPLTLATAGGHGKCILLLLNHEALTTPRNFQGNDALDIAFGNDDVECVYILVAHGADLTPLRHRSRLPELLWKLKGLLESDFHGRVYESRYGKRKVNIILAPEKVQIARSRLKGFREDLGTLPSQLYPRGDLSPQWKRAINAIRAARTFQSPGSPYKNDLSRGGLRNRPRWDDHSTHQS